MKLYVDDIRPTPEGWQGTDSITKAIYWLSMGMVNEISLDFDYGNERESFCAIAYYLATMPQELRPKKIHFHTDNPVGREKMKQLLKGEGYDTHN
jgi:hypothetical protein